MSLIGAIQETPKGTLDASCQFKTSCGREGAWWSIMASLKRRRQKAADVLSRRIDTACRSRLTGCSQTFGRKPHFCLSTPAWFYNSLVFCWEELELKLTCEGEKVKKNLSICSHGFSWTSWETPRLLTVCPAASLDMSRWPPPPPLCPSARRTEKLIIFIQSFSFSIQYSTGWCWNTETWGQWRHNGHVFLLDTIENLQPITNKMQK